MFFIKLMIRSNFHSAQNQVHNTSHSLTFFFNVLMQKYQTQTPDGSVLKF